MSKETAEEKLLKMLKKTDTAVAGSVDKVKLPAKNKFLISINIQTINLLLLLGIVVCVAMVLLQMRAGVLLLNQNVDLSEGLSSTSVAAGMALPSTRNISIYLDKVNARNIFKPFDGQVVSKASPAKVGLVSKLAKFKLVGVAWLDLPETASIMIENTASKQTYFLKQGEQIEGVTVKTIYVDRAVFGDENEETTIKL